jgi:hypothetical protein
MGSLGFKGVGVGFKRVEGWGSRDLGLGMRCSAVEQSPKTIGGASHHFLFFSKTSKSYRPQKSYFLVGM